MNNDYTQSLEQIELTYNVNANRYIINASYIREYINGNVDRIIIENLPIDLYDEPIVTHDISFCGLPDIGVDLGFGELDYEHGFTTETTKRIHTETKEMTIEEIEKELGYKVKIVNKKEVMRNDNNAKSTRTNNVSVI